MILARNIFNLKRDPFVTTPHEYMTHFDAQPDFVAQKF